jgi:hypothetical protein
MKETELRERFRNNLDKLLEELPVYDIKYDVPLAKGKKGARADMIAAVRVGAVTRRLVFEFKQRGFPMELERGVANLKALTGHNPKYIPVMVTPFLSESGRQFLRSSGVNYMDLSGNSFLSFDNVLIHKKAPANAYVSKKEGINIFADKASLILRELIADPDRYYTVRGLAEATRNSVGWTSEVLREIEERGYLDRRLRQGCRLKRMQFLLNDWTDEYAFPGKNKMKNYFLKAESLSEILGIIRKLELPVEVDYALTLHAGAHLVSPFVQFNECHFYVSAQSDFEQQAEFFAAKLNLLELDAGGNLHILRPYYRKGAMYRARSIEGLRVVSDLQLYLDLYRYPSRGKEQAERVLERSGLKLEQGWA